MKADKIKITVGIVPACLFLAPRSPWTSSRGRQATGGYQQRAKGKEQ